MSHLCGFSSLTLGLFTWLASIHHLIHLLISRQDHCKISHIQYIECSTWIMQGVVLWIRMAPEGSYLSTWSQLVKLFGKDKKVWPCWKDVSWGRLWGFKAPVSPSIPSLPPAWGPSCEFPTLFAIMLMLHYHGFKPSKTLNPIKLVIGFVLKTWWM